MYKKKNKEYILGKVEDEAVDRYFKKYVNKKYSSFEKFQKDIFENLERSSKEILEGKCKSVEEVFQSLESKYEIS
ncbi:MAG: hypothetical protein IJ809_04230 [Clostridia bacterium]|nr:hypothetical protein [Clostridia bacterium]